MSPIVAGDEEANDAHTRRDAPSCTLRRARWPATGDSLASPPTLSRWANRGSRPARSRLARGLLEHFLASYAKPPPGIVLAVEATADRGHGPQEQARDDGSDGG